MSPKKEKQKPAKSTTATNKKSKGFTEEERAAMKERAQELKAEARRGARTLRQADNRTLRGLRASKANDDGQTDAARTWLTLWPHHEAAERMRAQCAVPSVAQVRIEHLTRPDTELQSAPSSTLHRLLSRGSPYSVVRRQCHFASPATFPASSLTPDARPMMVKGT